MLIPNLTAMGTLGRLMDSDPPRRLMDSDPLLVFGRLAHSPSFWLQSLLGRWMAANKAFFAASVLENRK